jgi:hypothetical protein
VPTEVLATHRADQQIAGLDRTGAKALLKRRQRRPDLREVLAELPRRGRGDHKGTPMDRAPLHRDIPGRDIRSQDLGRVLDAMEAACGGTPECKCPAATS